MLVRAGRLMAVATLIGIGGCSRPADEPSVAKAAGPQVAPAAVASGSEAEKKLLHLEAVYGDGDSVTGEASYKVKRRGSLLIREFELEVDDGEPGSVHAVTLDGVRIADLEIDLDGEGDLDYVDDGEDFFPQGFPELKVGSVVAVGDLFTIVLQTLERPVDLRVDFGDEPAVFGSARFRIEKLGDVVTREFRVELEHAEPEAAFDVRLDGALIGRLLVDIEGEAEIRFGPGHDPFPEGFVEPAAGALIEIGDLFAVRLRELGGMP